MYEMKVFKNVEFGQIRTVEVQDKVMFCGSDVAKALGYARPNDAISSHCRATVKYSTPISGKMQDVNYISEGDIYRLIIRSKLPSAEKFESWVFDEVLPSIRKTGTYSVNQQIDTTTLAIAKIIQAKDGLEQALAIKEYTDIVKQPLLKKIEEQAPKVELAEQVLLSNDTISMREMAVLATKNSIKIGRTKLFEFLRDKNLIDWQNVPYQSAMDRGLFEVIESSYKVGKTFHIKKTTRVTTKGQKAIISMLNKAKNQDNPIMGL